ASPQVDKAKVQPLVGAAAGPHDEQGQAFPNPNPQWPNSGPSWSYAFTPKMTEALTTAIDSSVKSLAAEASKGLKATHEQVFASLATAHERFRTATESNGRQTELLW